MNNVAVVVGAVGFILPSPVNPLWDGIVSTESFLRKWGQCMSMRIILVGELTGYCVFKVGSIDS